MHRVDTIVSDERDKVEEKSHVKWALSMNDYPIGYSTVTHRLNLLQKVPLLSLVTILVMMVKTL